MKYSHHKRHYVQSFFQILIISPTNPVTFIFQTTRLRKHTDESFRKCCIDEWALHLIRMIGRYIVEPLKFTLCAYLLNATTFVAAAGTGYAVCLAAGVLVQCPCKMTSYPGRFKRDRLILRTATRSRLTRRSSRTRTAGAAPRPIQSSKSLPRSPIASWCVHEARFFKRPSGGRRSNINAKTRSDTAIANSFKPVNIVFRCSVFIVTLFSEVLIFFGLIVVKSIRHDPTDVSLKVPIHWSKVCGSYELPKTNLPVCQSIKLSESITVKKFHLGFNKKKINRAKVTLGMLDTRCICIHGIDAFFLTFFRLGRLNTYCIVRRF